MPDYPAISIIATLYREDECWSMLIDLKTDLWKLWRRQNFSNHLTSGPQFNRTGDNSRGCGVGINKGHRKEPERKNRVLQFVKRTRSRKKCAFGNSFPWRYASPCNCLGPRMQLLSQAALYVRRSSRELIMYVVSSVTKNVSNCRKWRRMHSFFLINSNGSVIALAVAFRLVVDLHWRA